MRSRASQGVLEDCSRHSQKLLACTRVRPWVLRGLISLPNLNRGKRAVVVWTNPSDPKLVKLILHATVIHVPTASNCYDGDEENQIADKEPFHARHSSCPAAPPVRIQRMRGSRKYQPTRPRIAANVAPIIVRRYRQPIAAPTKITERPDARSNNITSSRESGVLDSNRRLATTMLDDTPTRLTAESRSRIRN